MRKSLEQLKKELVACQGLIQLMENLFGKAQSKMSKEEIMKYEKWMVELRKEESLLMDAFFRAGGKL